MSNVSISELAPAASLSGVELLEIVQGGASKSATALQIAGTRTIVLADISDMTGYGRVVAASASLSELMDGYFGSTQGTVPYRGAASWSALAPGMLGQVLQTRGAGQNPIWATVSGVGTVVQVDTGTGLTGGPITSSGTISIASNGVTYALMQQVSANNRLLGNNSGAAGNVSELTASQALDMVGSTRGSLLYRGASGWATLTPGTSGYLLSSSGAGADPAWAAPAASVTNVATGSGLTGGPITSTGTISINTNGVTYALMQQVAASSLIGNPTGILANAQGITLGATLAFSGSALQTAALTGDVTASANSFVTAIAANAVTNAKLATVATQTLKGRNTAGTGNVEDITATQALDWIGSTQGTVMYRGAASWAALAVGTAGQVLSTNGAAANPTWINQAGGSTTQVQYNNGGVALGGSANFTWNNGTSTLTISTGGITLSSGAKLNNVTVTAPASAATLTLGSGKTVTISNSLTMAGTDSTTMTFPGTSSTVLTTGNTALITVGYTLTPSNLGTPTNGSTVTLAAAGGNYQYLTNNVAGFTIAAPAADCAIDVLITNGASAGTITFSGFTVGSSTGDPLTTTNTNKFLLTVVRINGTSTYTIKALQ